AVLRGRVVVPAEARAMPGAGRFDQRHLIRMTQTRSAALVRCYESELRTDPTLAGTVIVTLTIQTSGSITGVRVSEDSTLASGATRSCISGVLARFRFDPGPEDAPATYVLPLTFEIVPPR
nr:AgmX/PglI C-terminal domain-containing protein [Myxococcota bacterium]